jgi:hypothetical protein
MKRALLATFLLLAFPAAGRAALVTMVSRDVPLGPRALQANVAPAAFNMLGVHWQGSGSVAFRTRSASGRWSGWIGADADTGPDAGSAEGNAAWHDGNLDWVGESRAVQFRTSGHVSRLRAYYLESRVTTPVRRPLASASEPAITLRSEWQADEAITRAKPQYASHLKLAIVHHTAGANDYTRAQAAAIVRGIEVYHVQANGWNDIGYNFLVDRFGTIYEGRGGGITRNVIGAHAEGFNRGTVGVALIGNFAAATPTPAMQAALVRLLAWRLDVAHIDPLSKAVYRSGGNLKFKRGTRVGLRAISGHLDTGPTECPGKDAYRLLPAIARRVSETGLPKLYAPLVRGTLGGDVRFRGRLSTALRWTVTVTGPTGKVVASRRGRGTAIDWTWRSERGAAGLYRWSIEAGPSVLPATGTLGAAVAPPPVAPTVSPAATPGTVSAVSVLPAAIDPAADGSGGVVTVGFTLRVPATVTVSVQSATAAAAASQTLLYAGLAAGTSSFQWNLADLPDGRYDVIVVAPGEQARRATLLVDRTLTALSASPAAFSPNGDGASDSSTIAFLVGTPSSVTVQIEQHGAPVTTLYAGRLDHGAHAFGWDGTTGAGPVPDGSYEAVATVEDTFGSVSFSVPLVIDRAAPVLALLDPATLLFRLSEPAMVTVTVNGTTIVVQEPAGTFTVPWRGGPVKTVSAQAEDLAGNLSPAV